MKVLGLDLNVLQNQLQAMTLNVLNWFKYLLVLPHQNTISSHKTSKVCISIDGPGGLEQLRLVDIPSGIATVGYNIKDVRSPFVDGSLPESLVYSSTNVLVRTEYFSVNYADIAIRWGLYESALRFVGWPIVPGFDFSGRIIWAGDGTNFSVGDKVFGFTMFGAYSTHILVPSSQIRRVPEIPGIDMATAAAIPAVAGTALHALNLAGGWSNDWSAASIGTSSQHTTLYKEGRDTRPSSLLAKNKAVLIHSAAGGVGSTLIQICKLVGYSPIVAVVGSPHKVNICKRLGATIVIDKSKLSGQSSLNDKIMEASDHLGYIAIFDANGVETIQQSYDQLTQCGRLVIYGFHRYSSAYCNQMHSTVHAGD